MVCIRLCIFCNWILSNHSRQSALNAHLVRLSIFTIICKVHTYFRRRDNVVCNSSFWCKDWLLIRFSVSAIIVFWILSMCDYFMIELISLGVLWYYSLIFMLFIYLPAHTFIGFFQVLFVYSVANVDCFDWKFCYNRFRLSFISTWALESFGTLKCFPVYYIIFYCPFWV